MKNIDLSLTTPTDVYQDQTDVVGGEESYSDNGAADESGKVEISDATGQVPLKKPKKKSKAKTHLAMRNLIEAKKFGPFSAPRQIEDVLSVGQGNTKNWAMSAMWRSKSSASGLPHSL